MKRSLKFSLSLANTNKLRQLNKLVQEYRQAVNYFLKRLFKKKGLSEEFLKQYCAIAEEKVELRENAQKECIFLEDNRCIIYPVRPLQCRTFPFWPENLKSHFRWSQLKQFCRGIDQGKHHSIEKIEEKRIKQKRYDKKLKYSWLEKIEKPYIQS